MKISPTAIRHSIPQLFPGWQVRRQGSLLAVLAQQNLTIPQFEDDMARQLLITKMRNVALEGTIVTPQEIEQEYRRRNDKVQNRSTSSSTADKYDPKCR